MSLKEKILDAGCSEEFAEISLVYKEFYVEGMDLEEFIELVEEKHAIVEAKEHDEAVLKKAKKALELLQMEDLFNEEETI